ncbi:NfeD family protein [Actinomadura sp. HBU206391]|uniref:NfeD family protein n=1 Tax=Actinomadura sp. HBU206391 TaxID=2731692 RepID=UPI001C9C2B34|nr:nodulation protein NfeD [Actinomadura sp. HBU206391]
MLDRRRTISGLVLIAISAGLAAWLLALPGQASARAPTVLATRVDGPITPVIEEHLSDGVRRAERQGYAAYLVVIDTPGGLLTSTREIVQTFLGAHVPVIVYVSPDGARAASAGAYITMAAHVAAMAPGTHVGAGTPVTQEGEKASNKVINDAAAFAVSIAERRGRNPTFAEDMVRKGTAISAQEASRRNVIDLVVPNQEALFAQVDGRQVRLGDGKQITLRTAGVAVIDHDLGFIGALRQLLANPELAFLFFSLGTLAVIYELANPGMGFAGIAGAIMLVLGFVALSVLPVNVGGLLLLALAAGLFVAEILAPGVGVFAAGGAVSLLLAGVYLFRGDTGVDPAVLWPTVLVVGAATTLAGRLAWRARRAPATTGDDALIGRTARVVRAEDDTGQVLLDGAWWTVRGRETSVTKGQNVRVVDRDGLELIVANADKLESREGDDP